MGNKAAAVILRFFIRAVIGMGLIWFINQYILPAGNDWKVGMNVVSVLTSGSLGVPGVCLLYGIMIYQSL